MAGSIQLSQPLPETFIETEATDCAFCGKCVRYGHTDGNEIIVHDQPSCDEFKSCDSVDEFAMMTILQLKLKQSALDAKS